MTKTIKLAVTSSAHQHLEELKRHRRRLDSIERDRDDENWNGSLSLLELYSMSQPHQKPSIFGESMESAEKIDKNSKPLQT
ncbi:hypothetical protein HanRHA438_Chr05g0217301 [Helianthus annuus]|nr:hypothetical protein HanRHA438_Chr05g0217301 [Helianthus annuus]